MVRVRTCLRRIASEARQNALVQIVPAGSINNGMIYDYVRLESYENADLP